ncbi:MAG: glycyl radical enzyme [Deltaproteobacteria bacterium]|nr:glycyl radical enzyme [Deltaproteobacteria bacterium]
MGTISAEVLGLERLTLNDWPRLKRLREAHFDAESAICLELARNTTTFFRNQERNAGKATRSSDTPELAAGKLYEFVMSRKKPVIDDESLLAGTTTTKPKGVVLYPHFLALTIWPELETIAERQKNPFQVSEKDWKELNATIFPFWMDGTIQEVARKDFAANGGTPESQRVMERIAFFLASKAYCISHTIPDYQVMLQKGLKGIIHEAEQKEQGLGFTEADRTKRDFYRSVQHSLRGIISYAEKLSREAERQALRMERKKDFKRAGELRVMSEYLKRTPALPPQTFQEALNALWICKIALHQENANVALSLGRLDQILYPFYKKDIESGHITPRDAVELVGCLWLKIADHVPLVPEASEELFGGTGSNQAITLGGVDREGSDGVNDLTYVMLEVTELLRLRDPNVNARYHPIVNKTEYRDRLARLNLKTRATPCFHNDIAVVELLKTQGVSEADARDYGAVGCVEPTSCGRTYGATGTCLVNLTSVLELTLFQGRHRLTGISGADAPVWHASPSPGTMQSFDDFKAAFNQNLDWLVGHVVQLNNNLGITHHKIHPTPMLSAMMEGCMEKGRDVIDGGATYNSSGVALIGLAEVVDAITAVEEFVFANGNGKKIPMPDMIAAITTNWGSEERDEARAALYRKYHAMVKTSRNKFGYDTSPMALKNATWIVDRLHEKFQARRNYRGGPYTVGYWTMTNHAGFGVLMGAFPSGRVKGKPFASGITPVEGFAPELLSSLRFVGSLDETRHMVNGQALNLKFTPPPADDEEKKAAFLNSFSADLDVYFKDYQGIQVQCNIIGREELWKAHKNPAECPPDLFVRVSGYTAYFKDLNPHMQREIILRAEYDIGSGQEVWDGWKEGAYEPVSGAAAPAKRRLNLTPATRKGLDAVMKWLLADSAEVVLNGLLGWMWLQQINPKFRGLLGDFTGILLFQTRDGSVRKYVQFRDGRLETHEKMTEKPNVTITFTDGTALVNFLFSPVRGYLNDFIADGDVDAQHSFDILTGMLKNELTVDGNLNYLYRFGFLANHLLLEAFRPLVIFS